VENDFLYKIGLTFIDHVGHITSKVLISYCGSAEAVFKEKKQNLMKIPDIGEITAESIVNQDILHHAEKEIKFIEKNNITPLFYLDKAYPLRLKQCADCPVVLYYKGNANLDAERIVAIVGTRSATDYGKKMCNDIVEGLKDSGVLIVSGLAYGIDAASHKAALKFGLPTLGVVGHGLDSMYPAEHSNLAQKMLDNGGLLTDFTSETKLSPENFPKRNRIIAGLSDAVIVIESKASGGAIITADIAFSYSREVFAVPGRSEDVYSQGCNKLIRQNKACLIQSADDVLHSLGWKDTKKKKKPQIQLFQNLNPQEETIVKVLQTQGAPMHIDDIAIQANLSPGNLSTHLLTLEFAGILRSHPGKIYSL
jgi:DNA processing protein